MGINDHITIGHLFCHLSHLNEIKIKTKINGKIWSKEAHILMWEYLFKVIKEWIMKCKSNVISQDLHLFAMKSWDVFLGIICPMTLKGHT